MFQVTKWALRLRLDVLQITPPHINSGASVCSYVPYLTPPHAAIGIIDELPKLHLSQRSKSIEFHDTHRLIAVCSCGKADVIHAIDLISYLAKA